MSIETASLIFIVAAAMGLVALAIVFFVAKGYNRNPPPPAIEDPHDKIWAGCKWFEGSKYRLEQK